MSHQVEQMAYVGQTPWHGLGNQLSPDQPLSVWAKQAGMDWRIESSPIQYMGDQSGHLGELLTYPDSKVLYRSDTNAPLSVVSNRYQVVQPEEILHFYQDLTEKSGFQLETAGVLKGGKKFWALARTGQSATLKGNDVTNGYLLLATACDGTLATTAQFTSVRVVCNNTLALSLGNGHGAVKVPHNTTFDSLKVKQQLGVSVGVWDEFMYDLKRFSERKVNSREAKQYFERVFRHIHRGQPVVNERSAAKALSLFDGRGRGAELSSARNTTFGLLNAVTEFVDHERRAHSTDNRLDSAWFGKGAAIKQMALEEALLLAA